MMQYTYALPHLPALFMMLHTQTACHKIAVFPQFSVVSFLTDFTINELKHACMSLKEKVSFVFIHQSHASEFDIRTRSKHIKGSKEHYLLGQNAACKCSG